MDIENFYPKYPNIRRNNNEIALNPYDNTSFETTLVTKREFVNMKLSRNEKVPDIPGAQFNHQIYISRFLSSLTGYDELLLYHAMGSGKTCTSISAIEKLRTEKNSFIKGAIILASGSGLLKNYLQELLFTCTDGRYIPENYDKLSDLARIHRTRKITSQFYQFHTFEVFAKDISKMSDIQIHNRFDNRIIIIDEVHNLREHDDSKRTDDDTEDVDKEDEEVTVPKLQTERINVKIYEQFHRFLHLIRNRKIILMSGTPMSNGPEEFASVMNLILPLNEQFETGKSFVSKYFTSDGEINPTHVNEFVNKIKGRTSYLKEAISEVKKKFDGRIMKPLKYFVVYPITMSDFQSKAYIEAYEKDINEKSIFTSSRQASLFVFPDGSTGSQGFNKYITKQKIANITERTLAMTKKKSIVNKSRLEYVIGKELAIAIGNINKDGAEKCLNNLKKYSCKYVSCINTIIQKPKSKCFVYCQFVNGSGTILFAKILDQFGFVSSNGDETTKRKRYALISNKTTSTKGIRKLIDRYNSDDNIDGDYIQVLIGSRVINEGFTLKNVIFEMILTPHFHYGETSQAIARGWRTGSHKAMLDRGDKNIEVIVRQLVAMPNET